MKVPRRSVPHFTCLVCAHRRVRPARQLRELGWVIRGATVVVCPRCEMAIEMAIGDPDAVVEFAA